MTDVAEGASYAYVATIRVIGVIRIQACAWHCKRERVEGGTAMVLREVV